MEQPVLKPTLLPTPPASPVRTNPAEYLSSVENPFSDIFRSAGEGKCLSIAANVAVLSRGNPSEGSVGTMRIEDCKILSCEDSDEAIVVRRLGRAQTMPNGPESAQGRPTRPGKSRVKRATTTCDARTMDGTVRSAVFDAEESSEDHSSDEDVDWIGKGAGFWEHLLYEPT